MRAEEVEGLQVWVYELPEIRGTSRTVATINPVVEVGKDGNPIDDGRVNVSYRLNQLKAARQLAPVRVQGDSLTLVVAAAGYFGFQNQVPGVDRGAGRQRGRGQAARWSRPPSAACMFYSIVPPELPFNLVDRPMTKKALGEVIDRCYRVAGPKKTVLFADYLMRLGFRMAAEAGISICMRRHGDSRGQGHDPRGGQRGQVRETEVQYNEGLITPRVRSTTRSSTSGPR